MAQVNPKKDDSIRFANLSFENPKFGALDPSTIVPDVKSLIEQSKQKVEDLVDPGTKLLANAHTASAWLEKYEEMKYPIAQAANVLENLNMVKADKFHDACAEASPLLTAYRTELGQNKALYEKFLWLKQENAKNKILSDAQVVLVDRVLLDFKLSGIGLNDEDKKKFVDLSAKLAELEVRFGNNVQDDNSAWGYLVTDKKELEGLSEDFLKNAQSEARAAKAKKQGVAVDQIPLSDEWLLTVDWACNEEVMTSAKNRNLREKIYKAYTTRASAVDNIHDPKYDNTEVVSEILRLRAEIAQLLGFSDHGSYRLAKKMAKKPEVVFNFLNGLAEKTQAKAKEELKEVTKYARNIDTDIDHLEPWDLKYYRNKLGKEKFNISQEDLRDYFPDHKVLEGLLTVVNKLYGVTLKEEKMQEAAWDPSVKLFSVNDKDGKLCGYIYMDLYGREHKDDMAWNNEWRARFEKQNGDVIPPVVFLQGDFAKPVDNEKHSYLTHNQVTTFFHELGHALHVVLTKATTPSLSSINSVPLDGVEFPSQMMEYFCWEPEVLRLISEHRDTKKPLSKEQVDNLKQSQHFQAGLDMLRQVEMALFDMRIHTDPNIKTAEDVQKAMEDIRQQMRVAPWFSGERFQNAVTHFFSMGYDANYYGYKWSDVLASDAFEFFRPALPGLDANATPEQIQKTREIGMKYFNALLSRGSNGDFMSFFQAFTGHKEPSVDAHLEELGIVQADVEEKEKLDVQYKAEEAQRSAAPLGRVDMDLKYESEEVQRREMAKRTSAQQPISFQYGAAVPSIEPKSGKEEDQSDQLDKKTKLTLTGKKKDTDK